MALGVRTLRSLCIDVILVHSKGTKFLQGLAFMYVSDMVPDKLSIMMVNQQKFHLQFWIPQIDMHPFTVIFKNFRTLMSGIGHLKVWDTKVLEIMNVTFQSSDTSLIDRAIKMLGPEVIILMNCAYDEVPYGQYTVEFFNALSNNGKIQVVELGDEKVRDEKDMKEGKVIKDNTIGFRNGKETIKNTYLDEIGISSDDDDWVFAIE